MARVNYLSSNFTAGELSPRLDGRVDIKKYANGLRVCENFQVLPHGGIRKRSGTQFVVELKSSTSRVVVVPFQYNVEQAYCLIFGDGYVWFCKDRGIITYAPIAISNITRATPCVVTTTAAHGLSNGDRIIFSGIVGMTELNNRQVIVENVTATTFQVQGVDSSSFTAYASGGTVNEIVELTTTYGVDELPDLTFAQSNDTLYIAHKNHPLRKLTRTGHTAWQLSQPNITTGPFRSINADRNLRITPSSFSGVATGYGTQPAGRTCTLTASSGIFTSSMVGALMRLTEEGGVSGIVSAPVGDTTKTIATNDTYSFNGKVYGVFQVSGTANWGPFSRVPEHDAGTVRVRAGTIFFDSDFLHPGYCVVRITGYTSPTVVTAEIVRYQMPKAIIDSGTSFWEEGAWSARRGYPRAISFYEQRLFLAGTESDPTVLWGSRSGLYEDFEDGTEDDDSLAYRVSAGQADVLRWLVPGRVLTAGSSFGEFAIAASNQNEALTPTNFKASPQTNYGTSACPPVRMNQVVLYPQRNGKPENPARKLREYSYDYSSDQFNAVDLTVFSEHIFGDGIDRMAYQVEPDSLIWCKRTDGQLAACTYERSQEVVAWHRHILGGVDARATALCAIPGDDGDEVWMAVNRLREAEIITSEVTEEALMAEDGTIILSEQSIAVQYIEVMHAPFRDSDAKEDARFLDCMLTYTGSATSRITGLYHLRNEAVTILNNGNVETGTVDSNGVLNLSRPTTKAHIGHTYTAVAETEDFEAGAQAGTAQSRAKRISEVFIRLVSSLGGRIGPDDERMSTLYYRTGAMPMSASPPLQSGLFRHEFKGGWDRLARVRIEHSDPLPFHVTGLTMEMTVNG